jgi:hypothetical protein
MDEQELIERGANVNALNARGETPLQLTHDITLVNTLTLAGASYGGFVAGPPVAAAAAPWRSRDELRQALRDRAEAP